MYFTDIEVDLPEHRRTAWNKNKPYVTEIFSRKGKHSEEVTHVVGIATGRENGKMYPNEIYFTMHPEAVNTHSESESSGGFCSCQGIGQHLLIDAVAEKTGLSQILEDSFPGKSREILSIITYYLSRRDTDVNGMECYCYDNYTGINYIPDISKVISDEVLSHERIRDFLCLWLKYRLSLSDSPTVEVDFDSTNVNTSSEGVLSAERGKPKVDEDLPQVNFSYLVDRKTGVPMHFDMFYGSVVDMEHCKNYIEKVKAIKPDADFFVCLDRGYYTSSILSMLNGTYDFAVMGKDGVMMDSFIQENPIPMMTKSANRIRGSVYGISFKGKPFSGWTGEDLSIYLYYDSLKNLQASVTEMDKLEKVAGQIVGKKDWKGSIQDTWGKSIDITIDRRTKVIKKAVVNHEEADRRLSKSGYFYIVSDREMTPSEMYAFYRHRDVVEKDFRLSRSEEDLSKTYAQSDICFEAKTFLGFLCSVIRSDILDTMAPYFRQYSSETTQSVISEMGKIKLDKIGRSLALISPLTNRQKQIMSFYSLSRKNIDALMDEFRTIGFPN